MQESTQPSRAKKFFREFCFMMLIIAGIFTLRSSLINHYYVPSGSMEPNLLIGDRVLVDMRAYALRIPGTSVALADNDVVRAGDIIVFPNPETGVRLIKRVVGVGGQHIEVREGRLIVDGSPLEAADGKENFSGHLISLDLSDGPGPDHDVSIPDGYVLVMGDHRGASFDGRMFGLVEEKNIYGKAIRVFYRTHEGFQWRDI